MRHPQYFAFILIILGFLLQWPTLITLIMAPILIVRYVTLAKSEEKQMLARFGSVYTEYRSKTPGFFPSMKLLISDFFHEQASNKNRKGESYGKTNHFVPNSRN
jgi:steroid 5-alpha reductase family enzyme